MNDHRITSDALGPAVAVHLMGLVELDRVLALQQRLVFEASGRGDGQIVILLCEHPPLVTVGRQGSAAGIDLDAETRRGRRIDVRWLNRGGGCWMHLPGQLAVYPIVPLPWHGMTVGEYLDRLHSAVTASIEEMRMRTVDHSGSMGVYGRTGQLAAIGVAVKQWTTYHGAVINVCPAGTEYRSVISDPVGRRRMSSLTAERQAPVRMTQVRETIIRKLTAAFACERTHLYTGHPLLAATDATRKRSAARAG